MAKNTYRVSWGGMEDNIDAHSKNQAVHYFISKNKLFSKYKQVRKEAHVVEVKEKHWFW